MPALSRRYHEGMLTETLYVDPHRPDPALLAKAADVLGRGGLVALPTETVYGLAANALDPAAVRKIFAAKGRPAFNPLIVHVASIEQAKELAADWPEGADRLAARFWPGPLTLVLPKRPNVPDEVTAGGPTVALRCPAHPVARGVIEAAGFPLAAPSANRSNQLSPTTAQHVQRDLAGRIDLIVDSGPTPGGIESTVVDLAASPPRLLRPGPIRQAALEFILGPLAAPAAAADEPLRSPGQLEKHYAPRTPLDLFESSRRLVRRLDELASGRPRLGVVGFGQARGRTSAGKLRYHPAATKVIWLSDDAVAYAVMLYLVLHELDQLNLDRILLWLPPDEPEWHAVRDRLLRAGTLAPGGESSEAAEQRVVG